ncbi:MAG: hypothetical protein IJL71_04450, partial [Oscillospiraceae bacterium]|nr:hypothetical protein [Oscillospiraceae bacterium]
EETDYYNGLPINWIEVEYIFEPSDHFYEDLVGYADYVFVGKVLENRGEIYENDHTVVGEGGEEFNYYQTMTKYSVQVEINIKGKLVENIEIMKDGGLDKSGEYYSIMICDILPELGEKYIIFGNVREDGSLYVGGMRSMIPYTEEALKEIEEAAANQTVFNRQHHVSIYDVEYDQ